MKNQRRGLLWLAIGLSLLLGAGFAVRPGRSLDSWRFSLPVLMKTYPPNPLLLTGAWTEDATGIPASDFTAGEVIQYHGSGASDSAQPVEAVLSWMVDGTCGLTGLYTDTVMLEPGAWTAVLTQTAPACSGALDYIFQVSFRDRPLVTDTLFTVTNPVTVTVQAEAGFDKCNNPSLSQMDAWWQDSPYRVANIYIGGISRGCANTGLTPDWVRSVLNQGWTLIPTWVGLQAPCSAFHHRMDPDPAISYLQGRSEAEAASVAAAALGLTSFGPGNTIIYGDIEYYPGGNNPACRAAVGAYVNGWVERMHELGNHAGMYGGGCSSYISDWASIPNVPDDVWIAAWYTDYYDPEATVWYNNCGLAGLWDENQRIRQYAGDHSENWGGVSMTIDSDVTLGQVVGLLAPFDNPSPLRLESGPDIQGLGALSADQVWVLLDGRFFWSDDGGQTWADLSPATARIQIGYFLDAQHGWLVSAPSTAEPVFQVWRTADSGASWQAAPLALPNEILMDARGVSLDFINSLEGWLSLRLASSANFNLGRLYHTHDGGLTWEELSLPGGGEIDFFSATLGWTLAGPQGDEPYRTQNGGLTWQPAETALPTSLVAPEPLLGSLPGAVEMRLVDAQTAWAYTHSGACAAQVCTSLSALWRTLDGGQNWLPAPLPAGQ
jgi:hypothetical protein